MMVAHISSSNMTGDKDNHDDGVWPCTLEQKVHFISCKFRL